MIVNKNILIKSVETWGEEAQIDMAIEEMSELIFAFQKLKRAKSGEYIDRCDNVREEIGDVLMMMQQMRYLFGADRVDEWVRIKTDRLEQRLLIPENGN